MTIAQAFNEIAAAQGGTPNNSGTIAGAIDALNDTLAGSDQEAATTIEGAVRLLGEHIGGGSSVTVEALTATENKTYTAPEGKAYSPVTVNVSGGGTESHSIVCKHIDMGTATTSDMPNRIELAVYDDETGWARPSEVAYIDTANAGQILFAAEYSDNNYTPFAWGTKNDTAQIGASLVAMIDEAGLFAMPGYDIVVFYTERSS